MILQVWRYLIENFNWLVHRFSIFPVDNEKNEQIMFSQLSIYHLFGDLKFARSAILCLSAVLM